MRRTELTTSPKEILSHYINVVPYVSPQSFPYPEPSQIWVARDVRAEDWTTFVSALLYIEPKSDLKHEKKEDSSEEAEYELLQKMYTTLAEWNEGFFRPRGLEMVAGGENPTMAEQRVAASQKLAREGPVAKEGNFGFKFGKDNKFGLQLGPVLVGLDLKKGEKKTEK